MQVLPNPQQSLCLVQNLVKATIGSIAYIRMLFPEDAFETKGIDGVAIKTLKRDFTSESNCLLDWLEIGVFDALERKYLKQLVFGIYLDKDKPFDFIEEYLFEFNLKCLSSKTPILPINEIKELCIKKLALFYLLTTDNTDFTKTLGLSNQKTKQILGWLKTNGYLNYRKKVVSENRDKGFAWIDSTCIVKSSVVAQDLAVL
ncbi:hypothetical protein HDV06_000876 [Boothiomyces sp. JEL0866]|nr:hypothetical protein HDV06_000876 [Boothiomyces sp. JEL0866]